MPKGSINPSKQNQAEAASEAEFSLVLVLTEMNEKDKLVRWR